MYTHETHACAVVTFSPKLRGSKEAIVKYKTIKQTKNLFALSNVNASVSMIVKEIRRKKLMFFLFRRTEAWLFLRYICHG